MLTQVTLEMKSVRLKTKETVYMHCSLVGKVVSYRIQVNNSEFSIHAHGN